VKIRNQFYILLIGIILIPLAAFGAMMLINYYRSAERILVPGYKEIELFSNELNSEEIDRINNFVSRMPESIEMLVLNRDLRVLYSGFEGIAAEAQLSSDQVLYLFNSGSRQYLFQVDYDFSGFRDGAETENRVQAIDNLRNLIVITRIERNFRPTGPSRYTVLTRAVVLVLVLLFAFCAVIITQITRSIARSVTSLEGATKRIAEGNLDTAIAVKGGNEITSLKHSLNTMRLSLKEEQSRRSRFIMGVSHDLRTPLALIKGYTEAIADGMADSPEMREKSLEIIGAKIAQLEEMIDDLINFVKLDSGEWRSNLEKRAFKPIIEDYAARLSADGSLLGREVVTRIDIPETLEIPVDERLCIRALENLCGNALRYTTEGGTVRLEAELADAKTLLIRVSDNGCGIPAEDLPFIFDPFYRGSNSRREDGKGLGLSVVKSVADSHGWTIEVESTFGESSVFTVKIPLPDS
jgi:signal transduction histidine kinase